MGLRTLPLEVVASVAILKTTTAAAGAEWVKVGNAGGGPVACKQIVIANNTGVELQFGYGDGSAAAPTGETFEVPDKTGWPFRGIESSAQLYVRRTDEANTQVTFKAIAEGV